MPTARNSDTVAAHLVHSIDDPEFESAYRALDAYFGSRNEMETREVLAQRFQWDPAQVDGDFALYYEMAVYKTAQDNITLVGDYSVILSHTAIAAGQPAVVHLSHILAPDNMLPRSTGETRHKSHAKTRMYDVTVAATRKALRLAGLPESTPIVLAGEMEPIFDPDQVLTEEQTKERRTRVALFLHAGLSLVDPNAIHYFQPDFRTPELIDASGGCELVKLYLMLRRMEREAENTMPAAEVRHVANCLYHMYSHGIRPQDMEPAYRSLDNYPPDDQVVKLLRRLPTS